MDPSHVSHIWYSWVRSIEEVTNKVLDEFGPEDKNVIYFHGWDGFGAVPVLRSIAKKLPSAGYQHGSDLCFDKIIYIDCSTWENRRTMQRKIAEEIKLDHATMEMFDTQDEQDDFYGVEHSKRDVIRSVTAVIYQTLRDSRFLMIFINGSDDEIDIASFGIHVTSYLRNKMIWTFQRRFLITRDSHDKIPNKLRYTHFFMYCPNINELSSAQLSALLHEEATSIAARHPCMQGIDLTMVTNCCLYMLLLHHSFHSTTGFDWRAHASNYWLCDGVTKGDTTREIVNALVKEIRWEIDDFLPYEVLRKFMKDPKAPFLLVKDHVVYQRRPYRWVSITSNNLTVQGEDDMQTILENASSLFFAFERSNEPIGLPNWLFKHCSNLSVLTLSFCAFNFASPPFLGCHTLKFLGLDHCTDNKESEGKYSANWAHLDSLLVLDLCYTDWDDILSDEKMEIMADLTELNIEGVRCWRYTSKLQKRLPCLERLRIMKPIHCAVTLTDTNDSFMDKRRLEILDLSDNKDMKNLPTSISEASNLNMIILDGCDGLENVVLPKGFPSSLRSFSFDGYGSASCRQSTADLPRLSSRPKPPSDAANMDVKTLKISLQGCMQLESLFLRGLPNLIELDLSGSAIKILDFNTMVVDVPNLKRLFLLGCEYLRAIRWINPYVSIQPKLEVLCIDTRPLWLAGCTQPSIAKHESFRLQIHAILADARLARSLWPAVAHLKSDQIEKLYMNIHVTNPAVYSGFVQIEATNKEMIEPGIPQNFVVLASQYDDVFTRIGGVPSPVQAFPQSPARRSDRHIEISGGSHVMKGEVEQGYLGFLMTMRAESLNVHDVSTISSLSTESWECLKWCCVVRCPNLDTVFREYYSDHNQLETIWASDLPMARCIWSKYPHRPYPALGNLQHLHLRSCPRLQFVLPVWVRSFPNLRTLHIIHCGDLGHVFVLDGWYPEEITVHGVPFPKLTTIHLFDLPKLRQISESFKMIAPALETIRIKGCWSLRRLPALEGREPGVKKPAVEMEKDVWDALDWDGVDAGHHPSLFEPVHSRYYKKRLLKRTVLR
ncbi:hypothetical protein ACP70R_011833 [Stipagrostis hirtigluma subsp. patula]